MAEVYILESIKYSKFYIGSTRREANSRLIEHNSGLVSSTKSIRPLRIALIQKYKTYTEARKVEMRLKKLKRKDYLEKIIKEGHISISGA